MLDLTSTFAQLAEKYAHTETSLKLIANGTNRSLIVNGPPGLGKSYMVNQFLSKHKTVGHNTFTGHMTNFALYGRLYQHRQKGHVLVLDDVDSVLNKIESLNLLKAAMDTQASRVVCWESSTTLLSGANIPTRFEFNGSVVLISNVGYGGGKSKLENHLKALVDRSLIIRIADGGRESAFAQVAFMTLEQGLLADLPLSEDDIGTLLDFMHDNLERMNTISLRAMTKLASIYLHQNADWKGAAEHTLMGANS